MELNFEAESIEVETTELNVLIVGFYSEENYLMIQQSRDEEAEQNNPSGKNNYHIERDDQSYGGYGGVSRIDLERNSIVVDLDDEGKENLQCAGVRVDFETDEETFGLLSEKLKFIFGDAATIK